MTPDLEIRLTSGTGLRAEPAPRAKARGGPILHGYAIIFHSLSSDLGGFRERILPDAVTDSLNRNGVLALFNHNNSALLGRTRSGSLALTVDTHGLAFELQLPKTQLGTDVAELVARGDVSQMSFGFIVPSGGDVWSSERGQTIRTVRQMELFEISLVPEPAYERTSVALRAALDTVIAAELAARRKRLEEMVR